MQIANAVNERIQFTENASVALQQIILTHVHTKCPPLAKRYSVLQSTAVGGIRQFCYVVILLLFNVMEMSMGCFSVI